MKNIVTISLDDRKVSALKMYLSEKKSSLDEEISKYAEQLYNKVVPQNVRDFIITILSGHGHISRTARLSESRNPRRYLRK